jgi:DNA-binding transcriptional MerR regulator
MVGLPKSKIRFYEKYGLLPDRQAENGYRYYTHYDAFRVNAFLNLLQYGFSVEKAIGLLDEKQSGEAFARTLETQKESIERQIKMLEYRRERIDRTLERIRTEGKKTFEIGETEAMLYVHASNGLDFSPSANNALTIEKFYALLAVARCARIIKSDELFAELEFVNPSYVIAIPASAEYLLGNYDKRSVKRLEAGPCLRYFRTKTREESAQRASYLPLLLYIGERGLKVRGDILLVPSFLNLDGKGADIEELIVPIECGEGQDFAKP